MRLLAITAIIALFMMFAWGSPGAQAEGASLRNSYTILEEEFPGFLNDLKGLSVTDAMIIDYLNDLEDELKSIGPLTYVNFSSLMYEAVLDLWLGEKHDNLYSAMFELLTAEERRQIIVDNKLPDRWRPLFDAVKESLVGSVFSGNVAFGGLPRGPHAGAVQAHLYNQRDRYGPFATGETDFAVTGLFPPGVYVLKISQPGFLPDFRMVTVGDSGTAADVGLLQLKAGDVNGDQVVNAFDLAALGIAWGSRAGEGDYHQGADFNGDGIVDLYDTVALARNWLVQVEDPNT
jgi:hypothetical protein